MTTHSPNILIVDDSNMERRLLSEALRQSGYETSEAEDGQMALDILNTLNGKRFDAVLLDKNMPGMDGFEVLTKIKQSHRLKHLPVIMQTGVTDTQNILQGLKLGAYHYLTKPFDIRILKGVVSTAIENVRLYNNLLKDLESQVTAVKLLREGSFEFKTPTDALCLATHLAGVCPAPQRAVLGLAELLTNAIEHGNLGLSYQDKSRLIEEHRLDREIQQRLTQVEYKDKTAHLSFIKNDRYIQFDIEDEGTGFNWQDYAEFNLKRLHDRHGRGIAIAKSISFNDVTYHPPGNKVTARIDLTNK